MPGQAGDRSRNQDGDRSWIFVLSQIQDYVKKACLSNIKSHSPKCPNATSTRAGSKEPMKPETTGPYRPLENPGWRGRSGSKPDAPAKTSVRGGEP